MVKRVVQVGGLNLEKYSLLNKGDKTMVEMEQ